MASARRFALPLLGLLSVFAFVRGDPNVAAVNKICNGDSYESSDPYADSVSYVLEDMATVTANRPGYDYYTHSPYAEATAYGHAFCDSSLSYTDCATCVSHAKSRIVNECGKRMGVQMQLQHCKMRYENYQFSE
ncbi:antifungal protein ginkbilobin-like protein [Rhodamnia argentea]|uniref:Antifungal protein ginkbilobin-like protein n=1 Tax=Rhodamnia argentea TaxID=178133 RepID=A0A8B8QBK8_9MYRT|nr:antifungal protein ginkbilobin-like protein [Rhodamnia argentea]